MRSITIIGAGQSGMALAMGLVDSGYDVRVVSNRSADDIAGGSVMSSQCMFESSLEIERSAGLDLFDRHCPLVEGIAFTMTADPAEARTGTRVVDWAARLDAPARSVDQRVKIPAWIERFEARGGRFDVADVTVPDLESYSVDSDLVVVASGRGALADLFERDVEKSPFRSPQRTLALTYVTGMLPRDDYPAVCFNVIPGVGEYFAFPALTVGGPCEIMVFEGIPGGPMDCWRNLSGPQEHLERSLDVLRRYLPWEAERCSSVELTDELGVLGGQITPVVRKPVGRLDSGRAVLGMADAIVLNDPLTGQGANSAAKCAEVYLESIKERAGKPLDEGWMGKTFDRYWRDYGQWVSAWTNSMLRPPTPGVSKLLASAGESPALAERIVAGFDDPRTCWPWWFDEAEAERLIAHKRSQERNGTFDPRALRRAMGQFATGVTVITARGHDGAEVGLTANSFSSLSLDPPLLLWCLDEDAPSRPIFSQCERFAINVLSAGQHHLSRQFSIPAEDKFADVELVELNGAGQGSPPLLAGTIAHFLCRNIRQIVAGDHVIFIGEVERFEVFDGEPLVFHSGAYRVATRHPQIDDGATA